MNTGISILHCEIGTVNDQLYKKIFCQMLSLGVRGSDNLTKRTLVMDLKDSHCNEKKQKQIYVLTFKCLNTNSQIHVKI